MRPAGQTESYRFRALLTPASGFDAEHFQLICQSFPAALYKPVDMESEADSHVAVGTDADHHLGFCLVR
jgi:hypothetical protein